MRCAERSHDAYPARAAATRAATSADEVAGAVATVSWAALSGARVSRMSIRSSSGPDRRRRYCCTRSFAQVQRFVPYQPHGQGFMAAMS